MKLKLITFSPSGWTVPSWKMIPISHHFHWMFVPLHNCKTHTWRSEILWPVETTPEASSGLTNVEKRASAAGYPVYEILGLTGKMVADSEGAFRASYVGQRTDMAVGLPPGTLTCTWAGNCSVEELTVECTSMSLGMKLRLYATKGGYGIQRRKFWSRNCLLCVFSRWFLRTRGTLSRAVSLQPDERSASERLTLATLHRSCSSEVQG